MTTTMKKRMLALAAMMMLLVAMAIPAFADLTFVPDRLWGTSNNYLNIDGAAGSYMNNRKLTLYGTTQPGFDQNFTVRPVIADSQRCAYYVRVQSGTYAINRGAGTNQYGHNAIMWRLSDGAHDSTFFYPSPDANRLFDLYYYNESLAYSADEPGATVYFANGRGKGAWYASGTPAL